MHRYTVLSPSALARRENACLAWERCLDQALGDFPASSGFPQGGGSCSRYGRETNGALSALERISRVQLYLFCGLPSRIPRRLQRQGKAKRSEEEAALPASTAKAILRASFLCGWVVPELLAAASSRV